MGWGGGYKEVRTKEARTEARRTPERGRRAPGMKFPLLFYRIPSVVVSSFLLSGWPSSFPRLCPHLRPSPKIGSFEMQRGENVRDRTGLVISRRSAAHWTDGPRRDDPQQPRSTRLSTLLRLLLNQSLPQMVPGHPGSRK